MQYLIIFDTKFKILRRTWRLPLLNSLRQWLGDCATFANVTVYKNTSTIFNNNHQKIFLNNNFLVLKIRCSWRNLYDAYSSF